MQLFVVYYGLALVGLDARRLGGRRDRLHAACQRVSRRDLARLDRGGAAGPDRGRQGAEPRLRLAHEGRRAAAGDPHLAAGDGRLPGAAHQGNVARRRSSASPSSPAPGTSSRTRSSSRCSSSGSSASSTSSSAGRCRSAARGWSAGLRRRRDDAGKPHARQFTREMNIMMNKDHASVSRRRRPGRRRRRCSRRPPDRHAGLRHHAGRDQEARQASSSASRATTRPGASSTARGKQEGHRCRHRRRSSRKDLGVTRRVRAARSRQPDSGADRRAASTSCSRPWRCSPTAPRPCSSASPMSPTSSC